MFFFKKNFFQLSRVKTTIFNRIPISKLHFQAPKPGLALVVFPWQNDQFSIVNLPLFCPTYNASYSYTFSCGNWAWLWPQGEKVEGGRGSINT